MHDNEQEFAGKTVLITGVAGEIGRPLAHRFSSLHANVFSTDLREVDLPNFTAGDVSDSDFVTDWVGSILSETNRIDVLVNVAGICPRTAVVDISTDEWDRVLQVNLRSVFLLSQAVIRNMVVRKEGAIVSLASLAGKVGGLAVGAHYSASKAAIGALTKSLARYGGPHNVRANAVAPGIIDTAMTTVAGPKTVEKLIQSIPMARLGSVEEVIPPILFLASSQASYITGVTLDINGGILMD